MTIPFGLPNFEKYTRVLQEFYINSISKVYIFIVIAFSGFTADQDFSAFTLTLGGLLQMLLESITLA